jgi:hypothetical protein
MVELPSFGFSTRLYGCRFVICAGRHNKQFRNIELQRLGKTIEQIDGGVVPSPFQIADYRSVHMGIYSKNLLCHVRGCTQTSKIPGDALAGIHVAWASSCLALIHRIYPTYFVFTYPLVAE